MKVLICSSSRENLELCAGWVDALAKRHGILVRVEEWSSGRPLVDSYSKEPFDLLYLDTALKDMDGMEVARRLRLAGTSYFSPRSGSRCFRPSMWMPSIT